MNIIKQCGSREWSDYTMSTAKNKGFPEGKRRKAMANQSFQIKRDVAA